MNVTITKAKFMIVMDNDNKFHLSYYATLYKAVDTVLSHTEVGVVAFIYTT
jgi:hypothetical protein